MLNVKKIAIDTHRENIAFLNRDCEAYRAEKFQALEKVEIFRGPHRVIATLNIVDDCSIIGGGEVGLSETASAQLGLPDGVEVDIVQARPPVSIDAVRDKIRGATLGAEAYRTIIADIVSHRYSKMEIAAFLVASAGFMTTSEVLHLTRAMAEAGNSLDWRDGPIVDKHSIGGIPGNRTSMIVVPIVAAYGLTMPKTSSRAITSAAGTADTMEVLAGVEFSLDEIREIVDKTRACLVWGGSVNLSPADDILISVERPLGIDTIEQMVASILSKKLAAGSSHLLIDIPVGPTAKMRNEREAVRLRKLFEHIGEEVGLSLEVAFTDGSQPVGRGIGPVLEARDVMAVLHNDPAAPADLRRKSIALAGRIIEFDPALRGGRGAATAEAILADGRALAAMEAIIEAQGRRPAPALGSLTYDAPAPHAGRVTEIDCFRIGRVARLAGAPLDKGAGIDLFAKVGDLVRAGAPLYRIHASHAADFAYATDLATEDSGYHIAPG